MNPAQHVLGSLGIRIYWKATRCCWSGIKQIHLPKHRAISQSAKLRESGRFVDPRRPYTAKPPAHGLDLTLPPISRISDIFRDLVEKAIANGLLESKSALAGRTIRVATMCSGIETPLLAIAEIQDVLVSLGEQKFDIEHVLSAESEPFKQVFIERNFSPPIIFRDIIEMAKGINDEQPMATNIYGYKETVPRDVDILIAGTSCVDYSGNNSHQKGIDDGGESGDTFDAVLTYCKVSQPLVVIFENVRTAPWDVMASRFEHSGYSVSWVNVDTKDYYLPQTRHRGYMIYINNGKTGAAAAKAATNKWLTLMARFQRRASSPVSDFLLLNESVTSLKPRERPAPKRWDMEKMKGQEYRQKNNLGNQRPVTRLEGLSYRLPDHADAPSIIRESKRVWDRIDLCHLYEAKNRVCDVSYKECYPDFSQGISRSTTSAWFGIAPCILPKARTFMFHLLRFLSPEEALKLQGIPLDRILFTTETASERMDLAGNAMSSPVVGAAFLSAIIAGVSQLNVTIPFTNTTANTHQPQPEWHLGKHIASPAQTTQHAPIDMKKLLHQSKLASRACYCEGHNWNSAHSLQKCTDCGETTCTGCGGNPDHNYTPASPNRASPSAFESYARSVLPVHVQLQYSPDDISKLKRIGLPDNCCDALRKAARTALSLHDIRRTHCWTITYRAPSAHLDLVLDQGQAEWRLYACPDKHLPGNDEFRSYLEQPLIKAQAFDQFEGTHWQVRLPQDRKVSMVVRGSGRKETSWWARLGLVEWENHRVWEILDIRIEGELATLLSGKYLHLPRCGMASESLYKRVDSEREPVYLFLDPRGVSSPTEDYFLFSKSKARLEKHEVRPIIARVAPTWRPWSFEQTLQEVQETWIESNGVWTDIPDSCKLQQINIPCQITRIKDMTTIAAFGGCSRFVSVVRCRIPANVLEGPIPDDGIIKPTNLDFCVSNSWLFEKIRQQCSRNDWMPLQSYWRNLEECSSCGPVPPEFGDLPGAAAYHRAIHARPETSAICLNPHSGKVTLTLGANIASLAHRARSMLPKPARNLRYDWRMLGDDGMASDFRGFHLEKTPNVDYIAWAPTMNAELLPSQRKELSWMMSQERGIDFDLAMVQDSILRPSNLLVEVRARATLTIYGGICAAQPGFGKTIVSLALIQSELQGYPHILDDLLRMQAKECSLAELLPTQATLIVCPSPLFKQWLGEIKDKLPNLEGVIPIRNTASLNNLTLADFQNATIVLVSQTVLSSEIYTARLASFAAMSAPTAQSDLAYNYWRATVFERLPQSLRVLKRDGVEGLTFYVREAYQAYIAGKVFQRNMPSQRFRGREYVEAKRRKELEAQNTPEGSAPSEDITLTHIGKPLFEMFYWNRIIVDEFQQLERREFSPIVALKAHKRWGLSATPDLSDVHKASEIARLLGVVLPAGPPPRSLLQHMTFAERVDAGREKMTDSRLGHIRQALQSFLRTFARRNTLDSSDLIVHDHIVPVTLTSEESWAKCDESLVASRPSSGGDLRGVMFLLSDISSRGEQAVLFVQHQKQLDLAELALHQAGIQALMIKTLHGATTKFEEFHKSAGASSPVTVIVLDASNERLAAGVNLQNANHVIYLSPLLKETQAKYDAAMSQSLGRVKRYGQKREIHVYRFVALDTVDVNIPKKWDSAAMKPKQRSRKQPAVSIATRKKLDADGQGLLESMQKLLVLSCQVAEAIRRWEKYLRKRWSDRRRGVN